MRTLKEIFDYLSGSWKISRKIKFLPLRDRNEVVYSGYCFFNKLEKDSHTILYSEELILSGNEVSKGVDRHFHKLSIDQEFESAADGSGAEMSNIYEDLSAAPTHQSPSLVQFPKRANSGIYTQQYKYKYDPEKSVIKKYFKDDRLFYQLVPKDDYVFVGNHLCHQDEYKAFYKFGEENSILRYFVIGPNKEYTIENFCEKLT